MSKKEKKDDGGSGGLGWLLAGAAGAAILGAAAYGTKKLFDYLDEQERREETHNRAEYEPQSKPSQSPGNDHSGAGQSAGSPPEHSDSVREPSVHHQESAAANHLETTLADEHTPLQYKLEDYHNGYVNISRSEMDRAKEVVANIKAVILKYFQQNHPHLITDLRDSGSVIEGLKVVRPDEFDVMIPLHVHPTVFSLQYDPEVPGFYILKQNSLQSESYSRPLEMFLADDPDSSDRYLSPEKLRNYFQSKIQKAINGIGEYTIKSGQKGPSILLEVTYDGTKKTSIDFVPVMVVDEKEVVAKPHPEYLRKGDARFEKYWRESFSVKEWRILTSRPTNACHKKCLKIVKAARLNNQSQLGMLDSYVYKTLLLHMLEHTEPEEWAEECLSERFVDFVDLLHSHLRKGHLPHRFNPAVNLLDQYGSQAIAGLKNYLGKVLANNRCGSLLKTVY